MRPDVAAALVVVAVVFLSALILAYDADRRARAERRAR